MRRIDVLTVGETMGSIRATGMLGVGPVPQVSIAGAETNVAIGLARLEHRPAWMSVLGRDAIGDLILRTLAAEGVHTEAVRRTNRAASGVLVSQQRPMGRAKVDYHRAGSAFTTIRHTDVQTALALRPRIVHLTGITPALGLSPLEAIFALARLARQQGIMVSLDVNYRSQLWPRDQAQQVLIELAANADIVFGDSSELALLTGRDEPDTDALLSRGIAEVIIKLGGDGARLVTSQADITSPALPAVVIDPIGAGDAFVAGYLSGVLDGASPQQRLERGNACGAAVVSSPGDWESMLTREDLRALATTPGTVQR